jgi:transposase
MAMTIVESTRAITGGIDTHLDVHVAAVVDANGGILGVESFATTPAGFRSLHDWLCSHGPLTRVGVEGTGAYGAGIARFLRSRELEVIEVDRPNRQARRSHGKSDEVDAVEAARAALSGRASGIAKTADGDVEAIRALLVVRRSARNVRIKYLNQIRHLGFTAPDDLRERLRGVPRDHLARTAASLRPGRATDAVMQANKLAIQSLGRRVLMLEEECRDLDALLGQLVVRCAPSLLDVFGVGVETAAILLVAAGDNPHRLRSEAAFAHLCGVAPINAGSGKTKHLKLNPGGNRQANHALWRIVFTRMSNDPRTRAYVKRRSAEGRTTRDIMRVLKRYVAREIYPHLVRD